MNTIRAGLGGQFSQEFASTAELFGEAVHDGRELGASLVVIREGRTVVDLWGGWADHDRTAPWAEDTIACVWSITKTVMSLGLMHLVDQGALAVTDPVSRYWPEFGTNGKQEVTVAQVLSHSSGVAGWDRPITLEQLFDWDFSTDLLAKQAPWWEAGTASGYHVLSQGHLVGEIIRRVAGMPPKTFVEQHVIGPLQADFHIGLGASARSRVAPMLAPALIDTDRVERGSIAHRAFSGPIMTASDSASDAWLTGFLPSANGHGNARSVARIHAALSHGGEHDGVRLLSPSTIRQIATVQSDSEDHVLRTRFRFGLGFALPGAPSAPSIPRGRSLFWGGFGGSFVVSDLDNHLTVAYVMNRMVLEHSPGTRALRYCGDSRTDAYIGSIYDALAQGA